jgi:hypothetical protein
MSRHSLSLSPEQLTAFDLDAFVAHAEALNQHNRETCTTPFPKAPAGGCLTMNLRPIPLS